MLHLLIVLGLVAGLLFFLIQANARRAADEAYDQILLASAFSIVDGIRVEQGTLSVDLPYSSMNILAMADRDRAFYKVLDEDGAIVVGYGNLPGGKRVNDVPIFLDAVHDGTPIRLIALGHLIVKERRTSWATIIVAQTREERDQLSREFFIYFFTPVILTVVISSGLVWIGVWQALAPLAFLEQLIHSRQPNDFNPIETTAPAEVRQLVNAINTLMSRLKSNLDSTKIFLADMTHQIRTPLAALRSQAELALEEKDPDNLRNIAGRIHRNAVDASELTTQLLNHAMVVHRSEAIHPEAVDLTALARQVVQRAGTIEEDMVLCLHEDGPEHVIVRGDAVILREALANLVDNAVKYGGQGGIIDVTVGAPASDRGAYFEVADRGAGISEAEKPNVLSRFGRGSSAAGTVGSGLGLAIVASVAEAHDANFNLLEREGGGLRARLEFPPEPPSVEPYEKAIWMELLTLALCVTFLTFDMFHPAQAAEKIFYPAPQKQEAHLSIASVTDTPVMEVLIRAFQMHYPTVTIEYEEVTTVTLYETIATGHGPAPDLVISSADDLQAKLVNDGLVQPYHSLVTASLPRELNWRNEAFSFTQEPAVIVYNRDLVPEEDIPHTRGELINLLVAKADTYNRRVVTYDIAQSGMGYLLATQDSVLNSQFWQLVDAMADRHVRQFCCTGAMLDLIANGDALIGYNLLGSYARARQLAGAPIGIVLPSDYTLVTSRIASIPKRATSPHLAGKFIDYLLSENGQNDISNATPFFAVSHLLADLNGPLQNVRLGPGLLVFLDSSKRERFLQQWKMITGKQ